MDSQRRGRLAAALIVAAVVVVVALVAALILAIATGDSDDAGSADAPPTTSAPEPSAGIAAPSDDETTDIDLVGRQVTVVTSAGGTPREQTGEPGAFPVGQEMVGPPDGLELQRVSSGTTVMVSRSDGPTGVDDGVMTGYARSPGGAALLTANYMGFGMELGGVYADFIGHFMPTMAGEDPEFLEEIRARGDSVDGRALVAAQGYSAPRWFKFGQCDENFCTVEAALPSVYEAVGEINSPDPNVGIHDHPVIRVSMKWVADQWEIVSGRNMTPLTEIDGSWSRWM
ncbi:hypothetical protein M3G04_15570 [Dietzia cinnamea]|uniref:hypothetical protein n=1 Tax=Dietzia cinnamea TaxID=321318 RepID=UPI00223BB535|nr:hypothetical protein [Dietzia cinnamea]MCT2302296.1 hypothetical protein [Dietzia cinnamea]